MYPETYTTPAIAPGSFDTLDEPGFIRVVGTGMWTVALLDAHFMAMSARLHAARSACGNASVLVDLRTAAVQPAAVTARLNFWTSTSFVEGDRVAIVVASSLVKVQMRRMEVAATRELFVSVNAAQIWLCAPQAYDRSARLVAQVSR